MERCGKINASNSGSDSWTGIGVVAGFCTVVLIMQWPHRRKGEVTRRSELLQRLQDVRGNCKTRNQLSWTSDQLSQYGSKPVIITARDATYVLDAILGNETELAIVEHTTDTAGATEIIFALFDLLGLRFTPRLRDIGSRRLYRSGAIDLHNYP